MTLEDASRDPAVRAWMAKKLFAAQDVQPFRQVTEHQSAGGRKPGAFSPRPKRGR